MRIAVASGKGGTGKTTVAAGLALSLAAEAAPPPIFLDCDVEAPNAHLFLDPIFERRLPVEILIPQVDAERCNCCGICAGVCQYHAIVSLKAQTLVFPQLCHGCGACVESCPENAIREHPHRLGVVESGPAAGGIAFGRGVLDIGAPMAVPIIRRLQAWAGGAADSPVIVDCPPGVSCPMVAALRRADFLLLVTEPTPFGLHDLAKAVQVGRELNIPAGVVINRCGTPYPDLDEFCARNHLPVLLCIPFEREIAAGIAQGRNLVDIHPEYVRLFREVYYRLEPTGSPAARQAVNGTATVTRGAE